MVGCECKGEGRAGVQACVRVYVRACVVCGAKHWIRKGRGGGVYDMTCVTDRAYLEDLQDERLDLGEVVGLDALEPHAVG